MLDLPPLKAMKEAAQSAIRLLNHQKPTGNMQGHMKIYTDFQDVMDFCPDTMPIRYRFKTLIEIVIPDRNKWETLPLTESGALVYYTEG